MTAAGSKRALLVAALTIAGVRLWMQLRGKTTTPFPEWAIGWGALFFILAIVSEFAPGAAGALSLVVVVADLVQNGESLFGDVSNAISGAQTGQPVFTPQPFAPSSSKNGGNPAAGTHAGKGSH